MNRRIETLTAYLFLARLKSSRPEAGDYRSDREPVSCKLEGRVSYAALNAAMEEMIDRPASLGEKLPRVATETTHGSRTPRVFFARCKRGYCVELGLARTCIAI